MAAPVQRAVATRLQGVADHEPSHFRRRQFAGPCRQHPGRVHTLVAAAPAPRHRYAQPAGYSVRRCRVQRFRLLWFPHPHADHRRHRRPGPALHRLSHDSHVLDHARGAAHRAQPPRRGHGLPGQFRFGLCGLPRQDQSRRGDAGRDAAPAWIQQLHGRQVECHAAHRNRPRRPVRRLAAAPRLRPLLRLSRCRDRPLQPRAGAGQHADQRAGHLRQRLPPERRSGRSNHSDAGRSPGRSAAAALVHAALARCPASPAGGSTPSWWASTR